MLFQKSGEDQQRKILFLFLLLVFKGLCAFWLQTVGSLHIQLMLSIVKQTVGNNTVPFLGQNWIDFSVASFEWKVVWNKFFGIPQETEPTGKGSLMIKITEGNHTYYIPCSSVQWVQRSKSFLITSNISRLGFSNSYSDSSQYWYTFQTHFRPPWFTGRFNLHLHAIRGRTDWSSWISFVHLRVFF